MPLERIYLDMDGVLSDFDKALRLRGVVDNETHFIHKPRDTWTPAQVDLDRRVRECMEDQSFWAGITICPGAYELWDYCKGFDLHVLTATPEVTSIREAIAQTKREWIWDHFGHFPVEHIIVCRRAEKAAFSKPGHVLVDDMPSNCTEWLKGGGNSVLHSTAANSIHHLRTYHHGN